MARGNKVTVTTYCYVYKAAYDVIITTFALIVIFQAAEDLQKSVRATVVPPAHTGAKLSVKGLAGLVRVPLFVRATLAVGPAQSVRGGAK